MAARPVPLRRKHVNLTRDSLIDAARKLFQAKGFRETTIDEISRAAGTSRVTFYAHFGDKQDVLRALGTFMWDRNLELFTAFGALPDWSRKSVSGWIEMVMTAYEREWALARVLWSEMPALGNAMMPHVDQWAAAMTSDKERWLRFPEPDRRVRPYLLIFQINRTLGAWQGAGWGEERKALLETLTNVWLLTLGEDLNPEKRKTSRVVAQDGPKASRRKLADRG